MPTATVEDYLKAIYTLQRESATGEATVARLAAALGVTKGTVTAMVAKLRDNALASAERYGGITLTSKGTRIALDVIRRHRLIEVFLVTVLKFDWSEVHEEAERLEHAMSPKFLDRLDEYLGRPVIDPHGDPIPDARGQIAELAGTPLSDFHKADRGVVVRIGDQDRAFLEFAARHGLRPGMHVSIIDVSREADSITVKALRSPQVALSRAAAAKIFLKKSK
jgi:DtxR family Mn-dependent transcriptional regulator